MERRWTRERFRSAVHGSPGLARLSTVRFAGQFGDGMFQAALSGAILFNPERQTDPLAIAAGFTVLLLPYSIVGPFAGALLDRWDRRAVLVIANILRGLVIVVVAGLLIGGIGEGPILLLALTAVGISRFVLSGVSASLPHVVRQSWLVPMNSILATVASGIAGLGAATSVVVIAVVGQGDVGSGVAVIGSAAGSVIGAVAAARFPARALGPSAETIGTSGFRAVRAVAAGLHTGAIAVWQNTSVTTAMIGIGAHRIVFGADSLIMVLMLRADDSKLPGGLVGFGVGIAAAAAGMLLAAVVAPIVIPRLGRARTITVALIFATLVQIGIIGMLTQQMLLLGAFFLGLAGQVIKLTGDAAMQIEIDDDRRGQVFALQDTVFNIAFVLAIAVSATVIPQDGKSLAVVLVTAGIYVLALIAITLNSRRTSR
ncbi:MFS transporter [Antrihabitans cavernicola]|uniref:MFS transporter n=1 Tax=Antrihabitans cavernicola TaxID=2495913 RepID=A0A5A7SKV4_9NOCA|nr:MFS transporter [Spelaeibacter cavernicola]KAA0025105.1 MFS transporter [Spelaeibacter cavernicola]